MGRDILFGLAAFNVSYGYIKHRAAVDHQAAGVKPEHQQNNGRKRAVHKRILGRRANKK